MAKQETKGMDFLQKITDADRKTEFFVIALVALLLLAPLALVTEKMTYDHPHFEYKGDWHKYIYMAQNNPVDFHIAPYYWRIAIPTMAKLLPLELPTAFFILCFLGVWMTAVAVYYLVKAFEFSTTFALLGMLLFMSLGFATKNMLKFFWQPDALSFCLITWGIYCIRKRKDLGLLVLMALGVAVKESMMFVAPLYYTFNARRLIDLKLIPRTVLLALPALLVLFTIRTAIPQKGTDPQYVNSLPEQAAVIQIGLGSKYDYWEFAKSTLKLRLDNLSKDTPYAYTVGTFGAAIMLLPLFAVRRNLPLLVKFLPFLALAYAQTIFANNTERLIVLGFPAMIILALNGAENICSRLRFKPSGFIALPLLYFALNLATPDRAMAPFQAEIFILYLAVLYYLRSDREVSATVS
jgi:hypothetical protein